MNREYQHDFSSRDEEMYNVSTREKKASTMVATLKDALQSSLHELRLLNVGSSTGIIDSYLSQHLGKVIAVDIDKPAIEHARRKFQQDNLEFHIGDALHLEFDDNSFDIVICSQVYEHVPSPQKMMDEIYRVLVPGGICYFAASNRIRWNEPHYNLPLLSVIPRPLAHFYIRMMRNESYYHESHYTYWGLKKLVCNFIIHDYTLKMTKDPEKFKIDYMIKSGSFKSYFAKFIAKYFIWIAPGYIWLLEKSPNGQANKPL